MSLAGSAIAPFPRRSASPAFNRRLARSVKQRRRLGFSARGQRALRHWRYPKQKWGPALLPAPTAPSEGYAGQVVQVPGDLFQKSWLTSSGVASHLTTLSEEKTDRLVDCASRRLACLFNFRCLAEPKPSDVPRPFLGRPLLRLALLLPSEDFESRVALEEDQLFRRLFPTGPAILRRVSHCLSAEIGPSVPLRFLLALAGLPVEAGTSVPITLEQCTPPPSRGSEK